MQISISTPSDFNLKRTIISHGWSDLLPFEFDQGSWTLSRVTDLGSAAPVTVKISAGRRRQLQISSTARLSKTAEQRVIRDVRHMLRLEDDMAEFYQTMAAEPEFAWIPLEGAGRLLRSPTVFEDLVKMICTTNCSWALTSKMVTGLVENLGREAADGKRSFPTAKAMALKIGRAHV